MIDYNQYKEAVIYAGLEEYPVLVDTRTDKVVEAYVRGKWISTKYYTIWQEYYEAQKSYRAEKLKSRGARIKNKKSVKS
ncbi:MAG: hypothetical protein KKD05_09850 [Candidatus Omnitrophica bacterium]|nr:hypothetical protein [Candidatus Omnitrophota bacterium]